DQAGSSVTERQMQPALEWEAAAKPQVFELVQWPVPPFMPTVTKLTIERDENLQLSLLAEGTVTVQGEHGRRHRDAKKIPLGTFFPMTQLSLSVYGNQLDLKCHVEEEPSSSHGTAQGTTFKQRGFVETMRFGFRQKAVFVDEDGPQFVPLDAVGWRSDWYVNGSTGLRFPRETKRRQLASFKRQRPFHSVAIDECPRGPRSMDHTCIEFGSNTHGRQRNASGRPWPRGAPQTRQGPWRTQRVGSRPSSRAKAARRDEKRSSAAWTYWSATSRRIPRWPMQSGGATRYASRWRSRSWRPM